MTDHETNGAIAAPTVENLGEPATIVVEQPPAVPAKGKVGRPRGSRTYIPSRVGNGTDPDRAMALMNRAFGPGRHAKRDKWHASQSRSFMRVLEGAVVDVRGVVTPLDKALINSIGRHEMRARLAQRWLADAMDAEDADKEAAELEKREPNAELAVSLMARLACMKEISDATDRRDKTLEKLRLKLPKDHDPMAALFGQKPALGNGKDGAA